MLMRDYHILQNVLWITHRYLQPHVYVDIELKDNNLNGKVTMNTTVFTKEEATRTELKCLASATETVKYWYDGDFVILWSCVNSIQDHEEAVLVMQKPQLINNGDTLKEALRDFWNISTKYLSNELVDSIDWETRIEKRTTFTIKNDLFFCPTNDRDSVLRLCLFIGGYLFVLITFAMVFCGNSRKFCKNGVNRNKVTPYVI